MAKMTSIAKIVSLLSLKNFNDRSIKNRASNYIATFPLVASDGITYEELEAIGALQDAKRALDFSLVIGNSRLGDAEDLKGLRLHTNMRTQNGFSGAKLFENYSGPKAKSFFRQESLNEKTLTREFRDFRLSKIGEEKLNEENLFSFDKNHETFHINENAMSSEVKALYEADDSKSDEKKLSTSDVNRSNRALPMILRITTRPEAGQMQAFDFTMGIRTSSVMAPGEELQFILKNQSIGHKFLRKFARVFSGDFPEMGQIFLSVFNLDRESRKIAKMSDPSRRLYKMNGMFDENRAKLGLGMISALKSRVFIPNMTLVLSRNDVDRMREDTGIDIISDINEAQKIYNRFLLIDLYIVDSVRDRFYEFIEGSWEERRLSDVVAIMNRDIIDARKKRAELSEKELRSTLNHI